MRYSGSRASSAIWTWTSTCSTRPTNRLRRRLSTAAAPSLRLDHQAIDRKWQRRWQDASSTQRAGGSSIKSYILPMFPYPSGALHMGHLRVYTIADVLARFKSMQGYDVLYPMGWDAFGLPAENAAFERGVGPAEWTKDNIAKMKAQLIAMNGGMDWSREFMTCDPSFYKHTQRLFLLLHEHGLAYQAESLVNYDPVDRTVLANEQVDSHGFSWRSGAKVEQRSLKQWFLRVTEFKEALLADLESLGHAGRWPERVLAMQRNWIGRSQGAKIRFSTTVEGRRNRIVETFTTRSDTLYGAQFIAVSASHPLVGDRLEVDAGLRTFVNNLPSLAADSKLGYRLSGVEAFNPLCRLVGVPEHVKRPLPVFVAPYVLEGYGEGAVMGVPGHDERDHAFWRRNMGDGGILKVVQAGIPGPNSDGDRAFTRYGTLTEECGVLSGCPSEEAATRIVEDLAAAGGMAESSVTWRLRDWLISRQRYWGTPIPIIHCKDCGAVPVPIDQLPVTLPELPGNWFKEKTGNPLESAEEWINTVCPKCSGHARRDTDTMDTFVDSSWYFMRFPDAHNGIQPFSPEAADSTLPVDIYLGGIEHAILHLLYARFISKFLTRIGLWPSGKASGVRGEPFHRLISQGMVHGKTYSDPSSGRFLAPTEVDLNDPAAPKMIATGNAPNISWEKMSKSKHNGVDPTMCIQRYGADVTRAHILFQAPVIDVLEWEEERIVGMQRWFLRIWRLVESTCARLRQVRAPSSADVDGIIDPGEGSSDDTRCHEVLQKSITSVTEALERAHLNTLISDLIKLTNALSSVSPASPKLHCHATGTLLRLLAPVAPAFAEECWEMLEKAMPSGWKPASEARPGQSIFDAQFPIARAAEVRQQQRQACAVQENGRLRLAVSIEKAPAGTETKELEAWVLEQVRASKEGAEWLEEKDRQGKSWTRVVVARGGKTVNFVG